MLRRATSSPDAPFLFAPSGLDWRWLSWNAAAHRITALQEELSGLEEGAAVAFEDDLSPDAVLLDLAIRGSGRLAWPVEGSGKLPDGVSRVRWHGDGNAPSKAEEGVLSLERPFHFASRGPEASEPVSVGSEPRLGGAVLRPNRQVAGEAIDGAARALPSPAPIRVRRHVTLLTRSLAEPLGRLHLDWSVVSGFAVVTAPGTSAASLERWARPTVVAGPFDRLEEARGAWREARPRWHRLELWLHEAGEAVASEASTWWSERGVRPIAAPSL